MSRSSLRRSIAMFASLLACGILALAQDAGAPKEVLATFQGHQETVYSVALSADGKQLLTASFDKTIKYWDVASAKEIRTFGGERGHQNLVLGVTIAPDGQTFATASSDNTAKIWDIPALKPLREAMLAAPATVSAVSPDGKTAAVGAKDGIIKVWNLADGKELFTLTGHVNAVTALQYNPANAQTLASVGMDGTLRFWSLADGKPISVVGAHPVPATSLAFSANGNTAYTAGFDGVIKAWQLPAVASRTVAHPDTVRSLAISSDGAIIATASLDKNVRTYTNDGAQMLRALPTPAVPTAVAQFGAGGNAVTAAGTATGQLFLWAADGKPIFQGPAHGGEVSGLAFHPGGTQLATVGADGNLVLWTLPIAATKSIALPAPAHNGAVSADGKRIVTLHADNQARMWNASNQQADKTFAVAATVLAVSADGNSVVTAGADNILRHQRRDGQPATQLPNQPGIISLALHPNGSQVLAAHADGSLKLWALPFPAKDAKPVWEAKVAGTRKVVFEPKGNQFLSIGVDKLLHIGDAKTGKEQKAQPAHDAALVEIALSGDGTRAVTAGEDKSAKIWNLADGKLVSSITLPGIIHRVALTPNGARTSVAYKSDKGVTVAVFDSLSGKRLQILDELPTVTVLAFAADNRGLVVGSDKSVLHVDVPVASVLEVHKGGVTAIAYHSNGTQVFTAGKDKTVKQWDLTTAKEVRTFATLPEVASAIAVSRDLTQVAAAAGKQAKVWTVADGKDVASLDHPAEVISLAFNADRTRLVTGTTDNQVRVWDLAAKLQLQSFSHGAAVHGVAFHPSKPANVISASADKTLGVHTIALTRAWAGSTMPIRSLAVNPTSGHLLSAGDDKTVKAWNQSAPNPERTFAGSEAITAVAIAKNGALLAVTGADKIIRLFNFADANPIGSFPVPAMARSLAFHSNNTALLSAGDDKAVTMWSVAFQAGNPLPPEFGKPLQSFAHPAGILGIAMPADNTILVSAGEDKVARTWKVAADGPTKNFAHPNLVDAVAFSPKGDLLATACHDGKVRIWDIAKGTQLREMIHTAPNPMMQNVSQAIYCVVWNADGSQLASGGLDRVAKVWNATNGTMVKEIKGYDEKTAAKGHRDGIFTVAFSPDGKQLVTGSSDRSIRLWNLADGNLVREFANPAFPASPMQPAISHPGWIYHVRYTADGKLVSVGGAPKNHGYVAVWNPADGKLIASADVALGPIYGVAVTPDGARIAVACGPRSRQSPQADAVLLKMPGK